jgi:hypothetical protein
MLTMRNLRAIAIAFGLVSSLSGAVFADGLPGPWPFPWQAKRITTSGCTSGTVEGCLILKSPRGNYTLYVAPPRPLPGRGVTVTGTISNGPNFCMAGPGIVVQKWNYNRLHCPK